MSEKEGHLLSALTSQIFQGTRHFGQMRSLGVHLIVHIHGLECGKLGQVVGERAEVDEALRGLGHVVSVGEDNLTSTRSLVRHTRLNVNETLVL